MRVHIAECRLRILSLPVVIVAVALPACERAPITAPDALAPAAVSGARTNETAGVEAELAELRRLTAHYRDIADAMAAGYSVQVTPCLELPGVGGMGFHYGNPTFINDPGISLLQPELLLFEPENNGNLRFVGVEYIIPFALLPATATPPTLLGQSMHPNFEAGLWALHMWVGRENPSGIFTDWNPKVSCQFAS